LALASGTRLGPYEILSSLGAGGMGEVYRARDGTLQRDVALKILPESFATDPERLARFRREAQVLASLNHPHIGAIYGFEESTGTHALVLELVEGPTLADRIAQGAVPVDDALPIARQIAEALEAAHEQGIIHRDLKPANIKLRPDGTVKVLDFGLAKLTAPSSPAGSAASVSLSPTITSPAMMTGVGVLLGTAAYMSPEQAKGREADQRTDIWAFGAVLYEMLTGRRAFEGEDLSDTFANVLKGDPDWSRMPEDTPSQIRTLLRRSLEKDRKRRLSDIADARLEIEDAYGMPTPKPRLSTPARFHLPFWWKVLPVGTMVVGLAAGYSAWMLRPISPPSVTRFVDVAAEGILLPNPNFSAIAVAPDGESAAFLADTRVFLRKFDRLVPEPLFDAGDGVPSRGVFFSSDGQWIGFWLKGYLHKISVSGGAPVVVCALATTPLGATWGADNSILFGGSDGIWRVSADGGTPRRVLTLRTGQRAYGPQLLPDGRTVLFTLAQTTDWNDAQIVVQSLEGGAPRTVLPGGTDGRYVATGHLVYALAGKLLAAPFDLSSLRTTGGSRPVGDVSVWQGTGTGAAQFAVSSSGTLAYLQPPTTFAAALRTLAWVDRQGREEVITAPGRPYVYARLAPDSSSIALDVADDNRDIYLWRLPLGPLERVTSDPASDRQPVWTPNGQYLIYGSDRNGPSNLFSQRPTAAAAAEQLTNSAVSIFPHTMSRDGRHLVARQNTIGDTGIDLVMLDVGNPPSGRATPTPLVHTSASEFNAEISPDQRWLAYQSTSAGNDAFEVYVRPFPDVNRDVRPVSTSGGTEPLWSRDGNELFYRAPNGAVMSVPVLKGATTWTTAPPVQIIGGANYALGRRGELSQYPYRTYDVSPDGRRFLMIKNSKSGEGSSAERIVYVQNWFEELKRLVPVP
jgi:eukaryotic-like serine/threonine-protein kinase